MKIISGCNKTHGLFLAIVLLTILANLFVFRVGMVHGASMYPTLRDRSGVIVWQLRYSPQNGDVVLLRPGAETENLTVNKILQNIIKSVSSPRVR